MSVDSSPPKKIEGGPPVQPSPIEPLGRAEGMDDLTGCSEPTWLWPDIARELTVSLSTVQNTHQQDLRQARCEQSPGRGPPGPELDLLSRTRDR